MLKEAKIPSLTVAQPTHVNLFVEHYDTLRRWAAQLAEGDREQAEDLLHDLFIHFTLARPNLAAIQNLESYLYVIMRNLHLSQMRRATRAPLRSLAVVEYDTLEVSFWASDPRERIRMRDELMAVCQYACIRKESSKIGSALILRFFHGYYPEEIALVMRSTRSTVDNRIRLARAEALTYLADPDRLGIIGRKPVKKIKLSSGDFGDDLRLKLRKQIFKTREENCLGLDSLQSLYLRETKTGPDQRTIAHIVACQGCLDEINDILEIPRLASRYPLDTIGNDPGKKGGSGGGNNSGGAGTGGGRKMLDTYIRRRDATYYHRPEELCVSVNGNLQSSQKIASAKNELTLVIDMIETLGFVEVFSEQGIRLLIMPLEPPPNGDAKQSASIELSDGRKVDANLSFGGAFPTLQVAYYDPTLEAPRVALLENEPIVESETSLAQVGPPVIKEGVPEHWLKPLARFLTTLLRPARLTTAVAALLIVALLLFKFGPATPVSAANLLARSVAAEDSRLANKNQALHRTLDLDELKNGQVISRKKIDVWQSAEKGVTARRLYDEHGALLMGDWRRTDGIQTLYQRGQAARLQPLPENRIAAISFDDAWQLSLSAKEFTAMLNGAKDSQVEVRDNDYVISYDAKSVPPAVAVSTITLATIVLSKDDLHAVEQTFTLRNGDETRDYRMVETGYDWKPLNKVAPSSFEPNVELTETKSSSTTSVPPAVSTGDLRNNADANTNINTPRAAIATAALEVDIVEALNNVGAFMGEQVNVSRTSDGKITVFGLVETEQRKSALLAALNTFKANPAVQINIETVDEAQTRINKHPQKDKDTHATSIQQVDATEGTNPVFAELKKKFSDDEARRFSQSVLGRSRQAWLHAVAMKQIADRFSPADLQSLNPAQRVKWLALIRGHANAFISESESLRRELAQVFPEAAGGTASAGSIGSEAELQTRVRELYEASVSIDRGMDRSFGTGAAGAAPVRSSQFWSAFANALGLARSLAAVK
jgi:RNA polymerase sigma factor (sigma-70 family)